MENITEIIGWCLVLNAGILTLTTIAMIFMKSFISKVHGRMFGLQEAAMAEIYFRFLAYFKLVIIVFNLVPYLALKIVA